MGAEVHDAGVGLAALQGGHHHVAGAAAGERERLDGNGQAVGFELGGDIVGGLGLGVTADHPRPRSARAWAGAMARLAS